jgi:hypothetical protein
LQQQNHLQRQIRSGQVIGRAIKPHTDAGWSGRQIGLFGRRARGDRGLAAPALAQPHKETQQRHLTGHQQAKQTLTNADG